MQRDLLTALLCLLSLAGGCSSGGGSGQNATRTTSNRPPSISGSPIGSIVPGEFYDFTPKASDPEGHSLSFTIAHKPGWVAFSTTTGRLHGKPGTGDIGVYSNIGISVSDRVDLATGRPVLNADKQTGKSKGMVQLICPSLEGGKSPASPAAYSPRTGLFYVPTVNICMDWEARETAIYSRHSLCRR